MTTLNRLFKIKFERGGGNWKRAITRKTNIKLGILKGGKLEKSQNPINFELKTTEQYGDFKTFRQKFLVKKSKWIRRKNLRLLFETFEQKHSTFFFKISNKKIARIIAESSMFRLPLNVFETVFKNINRNKKDDGKIFKKMNQNWIVFAIFVTFPPHAMPSTN